MLYCNLCHVQQFPVHCLQNTHNHYHHHQQQQQPSHKITEPRQNWCDQAFINTTLQDPCPQHVCAWWRCIIGKPINDDVSDLSRRDQVLLAQLQSGYCHKLAAYHIIDQSADPLSRRCILAPHTLLQECPATANQRLHILGSVNPPLSAFF